MSPKRLHQQIAFLVELDKLKTIYRRSYLAVIHHARKMMPSICGISVVMALVLQEYCPVEIDINRVIRLLLLHDVVEIDAGDISVYLRQNNLELVEKRKTGRSTHLRIVTCRPEPRKCWHAWTEFEAGQTPEARFARAVDRIMPILLNYYTQEKPGRMLKPVMTR